MAQVAFMCICPSMRPILLRRKVEPDALSRVIQAYLRCFGDLYGHACMTPKFHMAMHLPALLEKFGFLPSCFALERKHKIAKRFGNQVRNTSASWDKGVLRDITAGHVADLETMDQHKWSGTPRLKAPRVPSRALLTALVEQFPCLSAEQDSLRVSRCARCHDYATCSVGDVVLFGQASVGEVKLHFSRADGIPLTIVKRYHIMSESKRHFKCQVTEEYIVQRSADISAACILGGSAVRTVLKPFR